MPSSNHFFSILMDPMADLDFLNHMKLMFVQVPHDGYTD